MIKNKTLFRHYIDISLALSLLFLGGCKRREIKGDPANTVLEDGATDFSATSIVSSGRQIFSAHNAGDTTSTHLSISSSNPLFAALNPSTIMTNHNMCRTSIAPGETCYVAVEFTPTSVCSYSTSPTEF